MQYSSSIFIAILDSSIFVLFYVFFSLFSICFFPSTSITIFSSCLLSSLILTRSSASLSLLLYCFHHFSLFSFVLFPPKDAKEVDMIPNQMKEKLCTFIGFMLTSRNWLGSGCYLYIGCRGRISSQWKNHWWDGMNDGIDNVVGILIFAHTKIKWVTKFIRLLSDLCIKKLVQ